MLLALVDFVDDPVTPHKIDKLFHLPPRNGIACPITPQAYEHAGGKKGLRLWRLGDGSVATGHDDNTDH